MLYSLLFALALLASPAHWCGGGRMCCVPQHTRLVRPAATRPLVIRIPALPRLERLPQPALFGLLLIAPRTAEFLHAASLLTDPR